MAINFRLSPRFSIDPKTDPMGRSWAGWDDRLSDDELWEANSGYYALGARVHDERFATLSFAGIIQVVAEITGFDRVTNPDNDMSRLVVRGDVLRIGNPVRDELVGRAVLPARNPVAYIDSADVDGVREHVTEAASERQTRGFLLTYNPRRWWWEEHEILIEASARGALLRDSWSTGARTRGIDPGNRVFLLQQGADGRGIIGSGHAQSRIYTGPSFDDAAPGSANYIRVTWDALVSSDDTLDVDVLDARIPEQNWHPQSSGTALSPAALADLEKLWSQHVGRPARKTTSRQGRQLDPVLRAKIEDAAQDRLMEHYRALGWDVEDTRIGHPYDARASRGQKVLYLEAKGTQERGDALLVTSSEVKHARSHPRQCVMGVLSGVEVSASGEVVEDSGLFRIFRWDPDEGDLTATGFTWEPRSAPIHRSLAAEVHP